MCHNPFSSDNGASARAADAANAAAAAIKDAQDRANAALAAQQQANDQARAASDTQSETAKLASEDRLRKLISAGGFGATFKGGVANNDNAPVAYRTLFGA